MTALVTLELIPTRGGLQVLKEASVTYLAMSSVISLVVQEAVRMECLAARILDTTSI